MTSAAIYDMIPAVMLDICCTEFVKLSMAYVLIKDKILMLVGLLTVNIHLEGIDSLKDKRRIIKSVVERLRSRFNASVAEIDAQDSKRLAVIGITCVSNDGSHVDEQLDKIANFVVNDGRFFVGQIHRETFTSNHELPRF